LDKPFDFLASTLVTLIVTFPPFAAAGGVKRKIDKSALLFAEIADTRPKAARRRTASKIRKTAFS
jgi:hypothetical protein